MGKLVDKIAKASITSDDDLVTSWAYLSQLAVPHSLELFIGLAPSGRAHVRTWWNDGLYNSFSRRGSSVNS